MNPKNRLIPDFFFLAMQSGKNKNNLNDVPDMIGIYFTFLLNELL